MILRPVHALRLLFTVIFAVMLAVTVYASCAYPIWQVGDRLGGDAWFLATLADAYCGFLTFFAWVAYVETGCTRRVAWLVAILLLGNLAMAAYMLRRLARLEADASMDAILLRRGV